MADDPSGSSGSSTDSGGGTYIAIGAGALIAGLLLWDALSGEDEEAVAQVTPLETVSTGIDWTMVQTDAEEAPGLIAVTAMLPAMLDEATALVGELRGLSGYVVYEEPIELGGAGGTEAFALARDFFGAGWLVTVAPEADSMRVEIYGPDGLLDTRGVPSTDLRPVAEGIVGVLSASGY
jgi:hypothetical protein